MMARVMIAMAAMTACRTLELAMMDSIPSFYELDGLFFVAPARAFTGHPSDDPAKSKKKGDFQSPANASYDLHVRLLPSLRSPYRHTSEPS
jgi:hypothetical protein